jgi:hypothetical protein
MVASQAEPYRRAVAHRLDEGLAVLSGLCSGSGHRASTHAFDAVIIGSMPPKRGGSRPTRRAEPTSLQPCIAGRRTSANAD